MPLTGLVNFQHDAEARFAAHHLIHRSDAVVPAERERESTDVPEYQLFTAARLRNKSSGSTVSAPTAPITIIVPFTSKPPAIACIASALVTVAKIALAPPMDCRAAAGSVLTA